MSYPFVSVCTPTFNRRPFIPYAIKCFLHQDYPKDRIEWIIIDDGTDPVGDLVKDIPNVKYHYVEYKMLLGKKRNFMHTKCKGDIIVYMDDDDYYPPNRVSHCVETLLNNKTYLIAGSSIMNLYYGSLNEIYQSGPYGLNHATAATFAFKKELLKQTKYDETDPMSEEKKFLKNYTIPLIQMDPLKTILVFSHKHNSLNKDKLLENPQQFKMTKTNYVIDNFISDNELMQFYKYDMNNLLEKYEPGKPENKPVIMKAIKDRENRLKKIQEEHQSKQIISNLLNNTEQINTYKKDIQDKNMLIGELLKKIKQLTQENNELKNKLLEKA